MILLTLDTSPESETALAVAADLARRFDQPLHLVLVIDGALRHTFDEAARHQDSTVDAVAQHYLDVALERAQATGVEASAAFRHGVDAATEILATAEEVDAALVVMATHGRSGLSRLLTGSVTEQVIRDSAVPVVVVPASNP